ncbi:ABC transporter substrate-binding protein [Prauserella marina]|uniref:Phospholipid/cholesterol/gamma-HCH transport system substrate-binding protein n=1 Tax=Prauserella marina TaxID=530584 RepID=A0A222VU33_9PSEU|nr:MCE family protein [Prauserella marina]ASR37455.1 ABC transporter substrate-binding protein [Prauserella marina]PWV74656.1 phospholipid/cholesterol/gamma-HCH transport system substrate-binding protein [Prauserella marina]SDD44139.1 phospholipid/cholesterol/gamma-HCH transport system substrate-binding protein [Prauserella marina]
MKPLRERNQAAVGAVTLVLLGLVTLVTYYSDDLPLLGNGTTYSAYFAESANLSDGNEVQVAGVKVGEVQQVSLSGKTVHVTFKVEDVRLGPETEAAIEVKTLLGEKFLALTPRGEGTLDPAEPIPLERTTTPYEIQDVFRDLSTTVEDIDTDQLAESFDVISESLRDTPPHLRDALGGLSALAETVSSRDDELAELLSNSSGVTKVLADRNDELRKVIDDGNLLLTELQQREKAIDALLKGTRDLSEQLSGFVADNREQLGPALEKLGVVTDVLQRNQDNLNRSLELLAPFTRIGANATGNGRWFEGYICGLLPPVITVGGARINPEGCTPPIAAENQGVSVGGN